MGFYKRGVTWVFATIIGIASAGPTNSRQNPGSRGRVARPELIFVQAPASQASQASEHFPNGSRIVRLTKQSDRPINLTPDFFAAADPEVSFEGTRILFSAKKESAARWQIWEMNIDGSAERQLTHCASDCLRAAYLPRDEIVFTVLAPQPSGTGSQLMLSKGDGSDPHTITFGPGDYRVETVLRNGLILASARSPLVLPDQAENSRDLYTLRPDGTGLASFRCEHSVQAVRSQAEELDDGSLVFVKSHSGGWDAAGELAAIRRGATHNLLISPLRVDTSSPKPLAAEKLIVARQATQPDTAKGKFDLYTFDVERGEFEGLVYRDREFSSVAAVPVTAHRAPRWYWSTLNPALRVGYFICLDATLAADAPQHRLSASLSRVRVLTLDSATRQERSLGEAPIEKDGSFYLAVPPDRPVRFELLDAHSRVVRAQRSWIWTRSGEEHGCVGCHEDRAVAPENRWPLALRRFDTPTRLGVEAPAGDK